MHSRVWNCCSCWCGIYFFPRWNFSQAAAIIFIAPIIFWACPQIFSRAGVFFFFPCAEPYCFPRQCWKMFPSLNPSSALVFHRFPICAWENFFPCRGEFLSPALRLFFPPAPRQFFPPALRNFFLPPRYQFFSILVKNVSPAPRRKFSSASVEIFFQRYLWRTLLHKVWGHLSWVNILLMFYKCFWHKVYIIRFVHVSKPVREF